jgi:Ca2+-binding EF-hand superfamily protein
MSLEVGEERLRQAVEEVFRKYDINEDSRLENFEVFNLFNDTLQYLGKPRDPTISEVREFIEYADLNKDNKIDKEEMLVVFKKALVNFLQKK